MKTLTTLDLGEPQRPWMTAGEHDLVEVECVLSGRAAVHNAVLRNGEGYMRQLRELPSTVNPVTGRRPTPPPDWSFSDRVRPLLQLGLTVLVIVLAIGVVLMSWALVKGAGID